MLGRAADCDVVLDSKYVSRRHGRIAWTGDGFELLKLADRNPLLVNGKPVDGRHLLKTGDIVQVADVTVEFWEGAQDEATELMPVLGLARQEDHMPILSAAEQVSAQRRQVIMVAELRNARVIVDTVGDRRAPQVLRALRAILAEAPALHDGEELRILDNGAICGFRAPPDALGCALTIVERTTLYNQEHPSLPFNVVIGIDAPDRTTQTGPGVTAGMFLGAARLADHAKPLEILVSAPVRREALGSTDITFFRVPPAPDSEPGEERFRVTRELRT